MFEGDSSGRWCIRHPHNSYTPNKSGMYDCYVEDAENPNRKLVKYIGSFSKLSVAKEFITNKWTIGFTYQTFN